MSSFKRVAVVLAVVTVALAACSFAFALDPSTPYDSGAAARGGLRVESVLSTGSSSESSTDNSGASAHSSGASFEVLGTELSQAPQCSAAQSAEENGSATDSKSGAGQTIGDETTPATVALFSSSCFAQAESNKNSHAAGSGSFADVSAPGVARATILGGSSQTNTTNAQASSSSSFSGVEASTSDGTSATIVGCSSTATATNGGTSSESESTLLQSGDQSVDQPDEIPCPAGTADATYSRG